MALTVPDKQVAYIKKLLELPDAGLESFVRGLATAEPQFNVSDLCDEVSRHLELPRDLAIGVVGVLRSLYLTKDAQKTSIDTLEAFVDNDVFAALKKAGTFSADSADAQWAKLRKFLIEALSLENTVGTAAKAGFVLTQHERIFGSARILTDIRPIFHQNVSERPNAAVIIHMLRITQRDSHRNAEDFFFALDSNDIRSLKALIDRAMKKEGTLKELMKDSSVTVLDPKEFF